MKSKLGKVFGNLALGLISIGVLLFLGSHSLNFFQFTFTSQDQIYSWLGLLLTSGGAIGWLVVFLSIADSPLRKAIALIMCGVGFLGEMITAVFDMQYAAVYATGFQFQPEELRTMTTAIGVLGLLTGLALAAYAAGDKIIEAFGDADSDGIPNYRDPDYKPNKSSNKPTNAHQKPQNAPQQQQPPQKSLDDILRALSLTRDAAAVRFHDYETFASAVSPKFDYISNGNMRRAYGELVGQGNGYKAATDFTSRQR